MAEGNERWVGEIIALDWIKICVASSINLMPLKTYSLKFIIIKAWICEERDQSLFVCGVHIVKEAAAVILA